MCNKDPYDTRSRKPPALLGVISHIILQILNFPIMFKAVCVSWPSKRKNRISQLFQLFSQNGEIIFGPPFCKVEKSWLIRFFLFYVFDFVFLRRTDGLMFSSGPNAEEGDLHAPRNIQGTRACDSAITWTAGKCFAVSFAIRWCSIRMFGHLFVDAERASDSALVERISWTQKIHCTIFARRDALSWLFPWKIPWKHRG